MKTKIKFIIITLLSLFAAAASAAGPKKYFDQLTSENGFDYTYVSPYMLKAMNGSFLNNGGLNLDASQLSSIETISTSYKGTEKKLWEIIKKINNDNKLEILSTKQQGFYRYDVLGKLTSDGKYLTHLLVITQNSGNNVSVVYIEGKIPMDEIGMQFGN